MDIIFRKATKEDLPAVLSLYSELGQDDGTVLQLDEAGRIFARLHEYPDYHIHVAEVDGKVIGTFALLVMDNLAHRGARSAILEDVVVAEELRGCGIGTKMLRHIRGICRERGCYKIALSSNRYRGEAHRFYEGLGFFLHGYSYTLNDLRGEKL